MLALYSCTNQMSSPILYSFCTLKKTFKNKTGNNKLDTENTESNKHREYKVETQTMTSICLSVLLYLTRISLLPSTFTYGYSSIHPSLPLSPSLCVWWLINLNVLVLLPHPPHTRPPTAPYPPPQPCALWLIPLTVFLQLSIPPLTPPALLSTHH